MTEMLLTPAEYKEETNRNVNRKLRGKLKVEVRTWGNNFPSGDSKRVCEIAIVFPERSRISREDIKPLLEDIKTELGNLLA